MKKTSTRTVKAQVANTSWAVGYASFAGQTNSMSEKSDSSDASPTPSTAVYPEPMPVAPVMRTRGETSISRTRVTQSTRMRFNPLRNLTPQKLVSQLDQFDLGFFRQAALTWEKIEKRDGTLKTVIPKRKKAVARHGWEIVTVSNLDDDQKKQAELQVKALTYCYNNLTATDAVKPDESGGLRLLAYQMMSAVGQYYAVHEIVWQPKPDGLTAQFVSCPLWWFEGTTGKLRYLDAEFQLYGREMLPGDWMVTTGEGLMEASSVAWMFKHLTLQDWLGYCEKFGQPFVDAATTASPGSDDWEALVNYVQNFGPDGGGVRSDTAKIAMHESSGQGANMYAAMVEHMDRVLTILWRGGDLGTSSSKNGTGASLQADESEILETDDAAIIEETLANKVSRYVISWQFGPNTPVLAYLKFRQAAQQNVDQDIKVDQFLLAAGAPLDVETTLERYGRPLPAEGATLLKKPQAPAVPGVNGSTQEPEAETDHEDPEDPEETGETEAANAAAGPDIPGLDESGQVVYAQALAHDLQSVADECRRLLAITDDRIFTQQALVLVVRLDQIKADITHLPKSAQALAEIQVSALMTGLTQKR